MNPDKLFDYLDGTLSAGERAQLEDRVLTDAQIRHQLAVAREIHKSMRESREILASIDGPASNRGAVLGRRIIIAFAVLVFANVLFGIYAIAFMENKRHSTVRQEQNRQQLMNNLEKSAAAALPPPSFDVDEIKFLEPVRPQQDYLANKVIAAAEACGGSGAKGLSDAHSTLLFAEIPSSKLNEFRERLSKMGAILPAASTEVPTKPNTIVQVRIVDELKQ